MRLALAAFGVSPPPSFAAFMTRIDRLAAQASLGGADLLALPEYAAMVLAGASITAPDVEIEIATVTAQADAFIAALRDIAMRHGLYVLGGSLPMRSAQAIYNRAPFIGPTGIIGFQDKQCMTRFEAEHWTITGGAPPCVFRTAHGLIGVSICYDSEFPLHVRAQITAGAKLILVPSTTEAEAGFNRVRLSARARAIENQCFIATIPLVGHAPWSAIIDANHGYPALFTPCDHGFPPNGVAAMGALNEPSLLFATADLTAIDRIRADGGVLNHRDWPVAIPPAPIIDLG
ncbi:MAG: carbon-nitrogen hydrolase family protein [Acidocella sp.]|nr:carbon-nitrogen hydrolase family protein [Acidocella sp.]